MPSHLFKTHSGTLYLGKCEEILPNLTQAKRRAKLLFTSPPFPLKRKKRYGNLDGEAYIDWLKSLAQVFSDCVADDGSIVIEMGNAWEPGRPIQSLLPLKALLAFLEGANLKLCQEFICYNPARLPSPAQWVTIERIRVKDSFTRIWWMSRSDRPFADNRQVLKKYSKSMQDLLTKRSYNAGKRPSEHTISISGFLKDNSGAIPPNIFNDEPEPKAFLQFANTGSSEPYQEFCRNNGLASHPARMPAKLAEFFIRFLSAEGDLVVDPFAGSNTVGYVASQLKRKWLSVEANPLYAAASIARFDLRRAAKIIKQFRIIPDVKLAI